MKNSFKHNLVLKIVSVVIAIILWSYIQIVENPETEFTFKDVSVDLTNLTLLESRGLTVLNEDDYTTDVTLKCQRWSLNNLKSDEFLVYCDMSEYYDTGKVVLPVKVVTNNSKIAFVKASSVTVNIEKIIEVEKPVSVNIKGKVDEDFYTNNELVTLSNDTVIIKGPESLISNVASGVVNLDIDDRDETFKENCNIILVDENNNAVTHEKITVLNKKTEVECKVYPKKLVDIKIYGIDESVEYEIVPSAIEIAAEPEMLEKISEINVRNFVLRSTNEGHKQDIKLSLPENVYALNNAAPQVIVKKSGEVN